MSKSLKRVETALEAAGLAVEILEFPESTRTAQQAADAAGCEIDQIAKSIIFRGQDSGRVILFVTAGGNRVCPERATAIAGEPLGKADAAEIRAATGFAIGGVAPFGHLTPCPSYLDPRLMAFERVWAAAGTPRHIFAIAPAALQQASGAVLADFTLPG
ncbi:YbaK/EbsC family protein [Frigidibacter sp. MR17.14]|uniref:YbaK/EbsC family protein n=1 Tax=Frigidibacter sp. MR17.14 TaxID=3126509 RepID=UPI003012C536